MCQGSHLRYDAGREAARHGDAPLPVRPAVGPATAVLLQCTVQHLQVACCFSPSNFIPGWQRKVITALRLVRAPSNHPFGNTPLFGCESKVLPSRHGSAAPGHS